MSVLIVIPARYASTRYPGKPLVNLRGASGQEKSLIERSWDTARMALDDAEVVVATDDGRIRDASRAFGAEVVMTSSACRNGTERCADAYRELHSSAAIVVNLQGDAPLTPPWFVSALVDAMRGDPEISVATPVLKCDPASLNGFREDRANGRVGATTAVFDKNNRALYFSKEVLPFTGRDFHKEEDTPVFHHVGVYAYRPAALLAYPEMAEGRLETWEGLEQLRFMENGVPVTCVEVEARGRQFWELNNPVDVARIESILAAEGVD